MAQVVDNHRATGVSYPSFRSYPVHTNDKALVLNGTGPEQCVPGFLSSGWPVGHVNDSVIIVMTTAEDGKTKVVAYLQKEAHTAIGHDDATMPPGEMQSLATVAEKMTLVVILYRTVWCDEIKSIDKTSAISHHYTARHSSAAMRGHSEHPLHNQRRVGCKFGRYGPKTCSKKLGQHDDINSRLTCIQQPFHMREIIGCAP